MRAAARIGRLTWRAAPAHLIGYLAVTVLAGSLPVAVIWLTKILIDGLAGSERPALIGLWWLAAGLAGATVLAALAQPCQQYVQEELSRRVGLAAQQGLFTALDRQAGLARFEDPAFRDRLQLAQQAGRAGPTEAVGSAVGVLQAGVTVAGFLASLAVISPLLTALVLMAGVPALLAELALSRRRAAMLLGLGHAERREFFYSDLLTNLEAAKEIRLLRLGAFLRGRMLGELRHIHRAHRRLDRRELVVQSGLGLLGTAVAGAGLVWAVHAASQGRLTAGDIALLVGAVAGVQAGLAATVSRAATLHHALLLFRLWVGIAEAEPDLPVPVRPRRVPALRYGIELRDVWFRYGDRLDWVLRGVNLRIEPGRAVALVGRNGAGKSTIVKLLCRLYDPCRGAVLWDGVDLRQFDPAQLRDRIAAVFQDYMAYELSAAENIGLGDLGRIDDRERIEAAASFAGVHRALAGLPAGFDTMLTRIFFSESDRDDDTAGVILSGGQWQRVALARAIMRGERDLLILDEPSSGLDAEAEHEISSKLRAHRHGQTSLLVSHRLGAIRHADRIVVLDGGEVVEQGDHRELLAAGGCYARLFGLQAAGYQPESPVLHGVSP